ncbi:MAG TPA: PAS domain-containing protein [Candidatus Acidoferrales bacterium]|nr:PAS domain-containing protein [Candidatus Acidoferrales bacterium]
MLFTSRRIVALTVDSAGIIRTIRVAEPEDVRSAVAMLVGRSLPDVFDREICQIIVAACRQSGSSGKAQEFGCLLHVSGRPRWVSATATSPKSPPDACFHILFRDVSRVGTIRVETRNPGSLLDRALDFAQLALWEGDLDASRFSCSVRLFRILQQGENGTARVNDFLWRAIQGCCEDASGAGRRSKVRTCEQELEFLRPSGGVQTLRLQTVYVPEKAGLPSRFAGIVQDVTNTRATAARLQTTEALLIQAERVAELHTWELDVQTGKSAWSEPLFQPSRFAPRAMSNDSEYWRNVPDEDRAKAQDALANAIRDRAECTYAVRFRSPDGDWRVHETHAVPIQAADGDLIRFVGLVRDITEKTRSEEALHRLSQKLMRARDLERRLMALELHETVGQTLAALKMTLGNLRGALPRKAAAVLDECCELAEDAAREVRTVSYLMHPPMLDEAGVAFALRWYVRGFSERSKIQVTLSVPEEFGRLHQEVETTLFRLVQEALTNVHRYSGSRTAQIQLSRADGYVRLEVKDQGCGLARPAYSYLAEPAGVGIPGMRERVRELKGILEIESAPGVGTTIRAVLPDSIMPRKISEAAWLSDLETAAPRRH